MAGRSRDELEAVRLANRSQMGLAGWGASAPPAGVLSGPGTLGPWTGPVIRAQSMATSVPGGLGGLGSGILGTGVSLPPVRVGTAFPNVDYTLDLSQPPGQQQTAAPGTSGMIASWLNVHVFRPFVEMPTLGLRYAPGDGQADYSDLAKGLSIGAAAGGFYVAVKILARAFANSRRRAS